MMPNQHSRARGALTIAVAAMAAALLALPAYAAKKSLTCQRSCRINLQLVNGKPAVLDDPIVIARGHSRVHVNWRAPKGWEFLQGAAALKQPAPGHFEQWCASDVDDDDCSTGKVKGNHYHCLALNNSAGTFEYRLRLRNTSTGEEHEIDPTIVNQGR
jgi:hypothetical protein